jgi:chromosome partitioning protein
MIPITVCNHKGGTGKTTTSLMVAAALGLSGRRVLAVDLDPQGFLSRLTGTPEPPPERSSHAMFEEGAPFDPGCIVSLPSFDLLPSSSRLSAALRRLNRPVDVLWVREFASRHLAEYDFVVYDTAAAVTVYSLNALVASRLVLIPVLPEYQPVVGAEQTWQTALTVRRKLNPGLESPMFLLTMVDARKREHHLYRHYLRERYGASVMEPIVRTSASLAGSRQDGRTAFDFDPRGRGAVDYANVVDSLLARTANLEPVALAAEA